MTGALDLDAEPIKLAVLRYLSVMGETLARLTCHACGHRGLALLTRLHRQPGSYRPLAFCPACGDSFEF